MSERGKGSGLILTILSPPPPPRHLSLFPGGEGDLLQDRLRKTSDHQYFAKFREKSDVNNSWDNPNDFKTMSTSSVQLFVA